MGTQSSNGTAGVDVREKCNSLQNVTDIAESGSLVLVRRHGYWPTVVGGAVLRQGGFDGVNRFPNLNFPDAYRQHFRRGTAFISPTLFRLQATRNMSGLNFLFAKIVIAMKINKTAICAIRNGGSDWVGASAFSAGTFSNACTTATKTFR